MDTTVLRIRLPMAILAILLGISDADGAWSWSRRERGIIRRLEKSVTTVGGRYRLNGTHWIAETEVSRRFTAELSLFMDLFSTSLTNVIKGNPRTKRKPVVLIFRDEQRYAAKFSDGSRGHYKYTYRDGRGFTELHVYSFIKNEEERRFRNFYYPILMHEGTHILVRRLFGNTKIPTWFDEGVATFFQFWDLRASVKDNLRKRYARSIYRKHVIQSFHTEPITLQELLAIVEWNPDSMGPGAKKNYAYAESFVDFLLSSEERRRSFNRVFKRLLKGEPPLTEERVVSLQAAWYSHIRRTLKLKGKG